MVSNKLSSDDIDDIREKARKGVSKFSIAKEYYVTPTTIHYHTKDIPCKKELSIKGNALVLLQQLLMDGYVFANENGKQRTQHLRNLQQLFPVIKTAHIDGRTVFFLVDKKRDALHAVVKHRNSRIINYHDLMTVSRAFNVDLQDSEKRRLLGKKQNKPCRIIRLEEGGFSSSLLILQQKLVVQY